MLERTIRIPLSMTSDELLKLFEEGDHFAPDPYDPKRRNLVSEYRNYVFEIERSNGTVFTQKIEKYPYVYYIIRDPETNRYFSESELVAHLFGNR